MMKYLSKIINPFKGNTVFFISLIAYLNSFVKNDILQKYIYITLGILLLFEALIESFYGVNLNWKTEKKRLFLSIVQCFLLILYSCLMFSNIENILKY